MRISTNKKSRSFALSIFHSRTSYLTSDIQHSSVCSSLIVFGIVSIISITFANFGQKSFKVLHCTNLSIPDDALQVYKVEACFGKDINHLLQEIWPLVLHYLQQHCSLEKVFYLNSIAFLSCF